MVVVTEVMVEKLDTQKLTNEKRGSRMPRRKGKFAGGKAAKANGSKGGKKSSRKGVKNKK